ncbi:MAG: hypothetical protein AAGA03_13170, partial [Planctomycetota bacterium]
VVIGTQDLLQKLSDDVLVLQLIQARSRTESVLLPDVDISPRVAFNIARHHRRDLANARAFLVDQYRQIEVVADDLESDLDLTFSGGIGNANNNYFNLNSRTSRMNVGLRWDAPLTRLLERNDYRAVLINYERSKRAYYAVEDAIWQQLRTEIRQLQANQFLFELGRQAVRIAAEQVALNEDRRVVNEQTGQPAGPTAARDAIQALDDLLNAQNSLLATYVSNEALRRNLEFDLGVMQLTPEGMWIDPGEIKSDIAIGLADSSDVAMIDCGCHSCNLSLKIQATEAIYGDVLYPQSAEEVPMQMIPSEPEPTAMNQPVDVSSVPAEMIPVRSR